MNIKSRPDVIDAMLQINNLSKLEEFIDNVGFLTYEEYLMYCGSFSDVFAHDLILKYVDVKFRDLDKNGDSILHHLAKDKEKTNLIKYLVVIKEMDLDHKNNDGFTPIDIAIENVNNDLIKFIINFKDLFNEEII